MADSKAEYDSIGGWLVLVGIGLVLAPILRIVGAVTDIAAIDRIPVAMAALKGAIFFEAAGSLALAGASVFVATLFFRRKRSAPRAVIALFVANIVFAAAIWAAMAAIPELPASAQAETAADAVRTAIICGIWIWYMRVSKRVKGTFVH